MSSRRKSFPKSKKFGSVLKPGVRGFICTCNGMEKICVKESYNILNEYADKLYGEQKSSVDNNNDDVDVDIADQFNDEIKELKRGAENKSQYRFNVLNSGIPNCIFIKTEIEDPVHLVHHLIKDLKESQQRKTRNLLRIVPVEITCYASMSDIKKAAVLLFDRYFSVAEPTTFSIVFNRRYNSGVDRESVIKELAAMVSERNADHKVDLKNSKLTITVEILKTVCCLSILPEYFDLCKYNLHSIVPLNETTEMIPENVPDE